MAEALDAFLAAVICGDTQAWPSDWAEDAQNQAWDRIRFHGIASLVAERVARDETWPETLRERVREEAHLQAFWEESHRNMLAQVYALLEAAGIEALVMKGTALAYSLYAEPAARRRGDTDLLVRHERLDETRRALAASGLFRRQDPHGLFFQETWLSDTGFGIVHAIDLHWQPNDSPALQQVLRIDEYFASAEPLPRLVHHAAAPDRVITFVQGAINQAWHGVHGYFVDGDRLEGRGRLIWAWDNHLLAGSFADEDWDRLVQLSIDRGIAPFVLDAMQLCRDQCATPVPNAAIDRLSAAPQETDVVKRLMERDQNAALMIDLKALPSLTDKARFLLGHALPSPDHLRAKYPQSSGWPVVLLYVRRLGETALRWLRAGAR